MNTRGPLVTHLVTRREFVAICGSAALGASLGHSRTVGAQQAPADYTLRIAPAKIELSPRHTIETVAYNGAVPGPLIRVREGSSATIDVVNNTSADELVHWHGLSLPSDVDGAHEEGTPHVAPHGQRRYALTPRPAGTRWYHTHGFAGHDLTRAAYTGQFGFFIVDPATDPARYDQEVLLALHDWDPYTSGGDDGYQMVMYNLASINGRMLGAAEPIRVQSGARVLFRILNASASDAHWLALAGHQFLVVALDGNPVPAPAAVSVLRLAPGERVDAIVTMNAPGVWILGETRDAVRAAGMGVVVEYADRQGPAQWTPPSAPVWDYTMFGRAAPAATSQAERIPLVFRAEFHGHGDFEHWTINGKSYPDVPSPPLVAGRRYRFLFDNQSVDDHPVHLHRHSFELVRVGGTATSGILKDVVIVPAKSTIEAEFTANNPGATLLHCHQQDHMDAGFMMLFRYA